MFIGSSPSSVGGGIRTTTFAILILFVINFNNNTEKSSIKVFNREIHTIDIQRSFCCVYNGDSTYFCKHHYYISSRSQ